MKVEDLWVALQDKKCEGHCLRKERMARQAGHRDERLNYKFTGSLTISFIRRSEYHTFSYGDVHQMAEPASLRRCLSSSSC